MKKKIKKNNMREHRPDIANYMDNYNNHYGVVDSNIPEVTATSGKAVVYCRCEHGHDFSQIANKISQWIVDQNGIICCPECHRLGIRRKPYVKRKTWTKSFYDYCNESADRAHLLEEWDYEKNNELQINPKEVGFSSNLRAWWRCPECHSYDMDISDRKEGRNCPICNGTRILKGDNDLESQYPDVALDWDYEKNELLPSEVAQHSSKKAHWKCHVCGHEWTTQISKRTSKKPSGCPKCINHGMSRIEMCIYLAIKRCLPDAEYRKKIDGVEFDIFIASVNLAIEYDGEYYHKENKKRRDAKKDVVTKENNIQFLRIKEMRNIDFDFCYDNGVLLVNVNRNTDYKEISRQVLICLNKSFNLSISTDVDNDIVQQAISQIKSKNFQNSLLNQFPEIAKEWHKTKNGDMKPEHVDAHSHVDVWWTCSRCGNDYQKPVHRRTDIRSHQAGGCPYCSGQLRKIGFNDLETLFQGISRFWCRDKNNEIGMKLEECSPSSTKYAYWKFGDAIQYMQIRSAVMKYQKSLIKNNKEIK